MHTILAGALEGLGIEARLFVPEIAQAFSGFLCFQHHTAGDLVIAGEKVAGSAQRRQRRALLQHGGLLLATSPHARELPGILELTGRSLTVEDTCTSVLRAFSQHTGWLLLSADWLPEERQRLADLATNKYSQETWNDKR
jgi:lipoate-protein ligase A